MPCLRFQNILFQTEKLDISDVSCLVASVLQSSDDALLPAANWVLSLFDEQNDLQEATGVKVPTSDISSFQMNVTTLWYRFKK